MEKPKNEGPAAYVFPGDDPRPGGQAELLRLLQAQGCEVHRATAPFTVTIRKKKSDRGDSKSAPPADRSSPAGSPASVVISDGPPSPIAASASPSPAASPAPPAAPEIVTRQFPAGSYIVRMDQPYSRIADALLDYQYWSPRDPQQDVYDDTGWTFGELGNVQVVRVTDIKVLDAAMERVSGDVRAPGGVNGTGSILLVNHNADNSLITLRYSLKNAAVEVAEEPFTAGGRKFNRGSFIIRNAAATETSRLLADLGLQAYAVAEAPAVRTHSIKTPRIALLHTWIDTQDEGWWRLAFDQMRVPYAYISTQDVAADSDLNRKYDAIIFGPVGRDARSVINGMPMYGNALPWKTTSLTPNIGKIDSTDDMRPGLGWSGIANLQNFVKRGGLLIGSMDTADLAVTFGFTPGVATARPQRLKAIGDVLRAKFVDATSPIAYGYGDSLSIYCFNGPIFNLTNIAGSSGGRRRRDERVTGRGTIDDPDVVQGRPPVEAPTPPSAETWEALPLTDEQKRNGIYIIPPEARPRVVLRYADASELLVSGLLDGGDEIAQHAAVIDSPLGNGHVVLFSNNPMWRGQTAGSYFLVFNAILNFDNLNAGRKLDER